MEPLLDHPVFQPYWVAYAIDTDCKPEMVWERDGSGRLFMEWNSRMWAKFKKEKGYAPDRGTRDLHDDYEVFLIDHLRNKKNLTIVWG